MNTDQTTRSEGTSDEAPGLREGEHVNGNATAGATGDTTAAVSTRGGGLLRWLAENESIAAIFAVVLVGIYFQSQSGLFLSSTNVNNLVVEIVPLALLGLAASVVILMRDIDLSLGSMVGLTAAVCATQLQDGRTWWVAIAIMLLYGAVLGGAQGLVVVVAKVPAFIATLGGFLIFLGLQLQVLGSKGGVSIDESHIQNLTTARLSETGGLVGVCGLFALWLAYWANNIVAIREPDRWWRAFTRRDFAKPILLAAATIGGTIALNRGGGVPVAFLITLGVFSLVAGCLSSTATGRHVYAIGGNPEAARRSGVRVQLIRWGAFVVAGALAACGGLVYLSLGQGASTSTGGGTLLLEGIGAAVIGGVSLFGGRGNVWGALAGAFVMGGIANGLNFTDQPQSTKYVIEGVVVIAAVVLDSMLRRGPELRLRAVLGRLALVRPGGGLPASAGVETTGSPRTPVEPKQ